MVNALQIASLALALAATAFVLVLVLRRVVARARGARSGATSRSACATTRSRWSTATTSSCRGSSRREAAVFAADARALRAPARRRAARAHRRASSRRAATSTTRPALLRRGAPGSAPPRPRRSATWARPTAIPALLDALDDPERDVRAAATRSLRCCGASVAVEPIVEALAAGRVQRAVGGWALMQIGDAPRSPACAGCSRHEDADVRAVAAELLGLTGDAADSTELIAPPARPARRGARQGRARARPARRRRRRRRRCAARSATASSSSARPPPARSARSATARRSPALVHHGADRPLRGRPGRRPRARRARAAGPGGRGVASPPRKAAPARGRRRWRRSSDGRRCRDAIDVFGICAVAYFAALNLTYIALHRAGLAVDHGATCARAASRARTRRWPRR